MRARYYSPELRRFINADIIPGEISNAITLNRYAYANGNPVSNIDPFGLKGFWSGLWNGVKKVAKKVEDWCDKTINNIVNNAKNLPKKAKKAFKAIENFVLGEDSDYLLGNDYFYKQRCDGNHEYNKAHDKIGNSTDDLIKDQDAPDVKHLKVGISDVGYSGCETVAVYNAKILLGDTDVSLADTIKSFEEENAFLLQNFLFGWAGGNPYSISRVLSNDGIKYETIDDFGDIYMKIPGIYIVSFWNSMDYLSMIHTITIKIPGDNGEPYTSYNGNITNIPHSQFITGGKVSRK